MGQPARMCKDLKDNVKVSFEPMKKLFCIVLAFAMLALAGCGAAPGAGSASRPASGGGAEKNSVVVAMNTESEPEAGFDPAYGWGAGEHVHEPLIQSTLTVTNADLSIGFDLATGMEVSEDGLTWTVTIRGDVRFTDGERLTAADVAFTYNTVKAESSVNDFTMLESAEAVNDTTVAFHMARPYSIWPYTMAIVGIVPEHAYGPDYGQNPIGSGRYVLKQWDKGQQVIFEANPQYYGEPVRMEKVVVLFMSEDAAFAAAKAGQVDVAYTAPAYADQAVAGYGLMAVKTVDNRGINLPAAAFDGAAGNDFTADVRVRQAVNCGIDRQEMIENVLGGYGTPAYSVCDQMPWYSPANEVAYDPQKAAALLNEAGWELDAAGTRQKDGVKAELTVMYPMGDSTRQALAADLANQLGELGIAAKAEGVDWDTAYARALGQPLVWGWGAHTPMELYNIYHTAPGADTAEYSPYASARVDELMDAALAGGDLEESYALWQQAQSEVLAQEVPWVWLVNIDHLYWVRGGLAVAQQKLHPHGHGWSIVNNVDQWSWAA